MDKRLLKIKELSEYISMPISTIRKMCCYRKISFKKIGGRIYFDKSAIDKWIDEQETIEPIERTVALS